MSMTHAARARHGDQWIDAHHNDLRPRPHGENGDAVMINGTIWYHNGTREDPETGQQWHANADNLPAMGFRIENTCELPRTYYVQGLETLGEGTLLISSGRYEKSAISTLAYAIDGGRCHFEETASIDLSDEYYGQGLTYVEELEQVYQLTWKSNDVHVWDVSEVVGPDGELMHQLSSNQIVSMPDEKGVGEGWRGLAHWSGGASAGMNALLASNATNKIMILSAANMTILRTLDIADIYGQVAWNLNELELIDDHLDEAVRGPLSGYVFANEAYTDQLHMIDLSRGLTVRTWHLGMIRGAVEEHFSKTGRGDEFNALTHYLNGIAYDR